MADFTRLANCTASSSGCGKTGVLSRSKGPHSKVITQAGSPYLPGHWGQVPDTADNGPAGHHPQEVGHHAILAAVPKGISKLWVILQRQKSSWSQAGAAASLRLQLPPQTELKVSSPHGVTSAFLCPQTRLGWAAKTEVQRDRQTCALSYLDGYRVNCSSNFEAPLFEHHHRCVVDACSCKRQAQSLISSASQFRSLSYRLKGRATGTQQLSPDSPSKPCSLCAQKGSLGHHVCLLHSGLTQL